MEKQCELSQSFQNPQVWKKSHIPLEESFIEIYLTSSSAWLAEYLLWETCFTAFTSMGSITKKN